MTQRKFKIKLLELNMHFLSLSDQKCLALLTGMCTAPIHILDISFLAAQRAPYFFQIDTLAFYFVNVFSAGKATSRISAGLQRRGWEFSLEIEIIGSTEFPQNKIIFCDAM